MDDLRDYLGRLQQQIASLKNSADRAGDRSESRDLFISHARLAGIIAISEDAVISVDRDQNITLFNRGAEKIFGYQPEEVLGKPLGILIPPRFRARHEEEVRAFMRSPDALRPMNERGNIFGLRKDGTEFPAEASISKLEIEGEIILNVRLRDITMQKRAEAEIQARARQQAAVARIGENALRGGDLSRLMNETCEIVTETLGADYCKVLQLMTDGESLLMRAGFGWKPGLVGRRTLSAGTGSHSGYTLLSTEPVVIPDLRNETRFSESLLQEHNVISGMSAIIGGPERPFGVIGAYSKTPREFKDDDINFLKAVANILATAIARSRTEEALRESNETLRVINEASPLAMWVLDPWGHIRFWNPAAERLFGWSQAEAMGRAHPAIPEDESENFRSLLERWRRGEMLSGLETRRRKKDGSVIEVNLWSAPLRNAAGDIAGTLVIAIDITERKRLEEQLRQSQKLESVGLLAGGIAHDFNNLLTGIMGNISLAIDSLPSGHEAQRMLQNGLAASERAADLIRQLLASSGKGRFVVQPVNLSELVREIIPLIQTSIPKKVRLDLDLQEDLPSLEGDPGQIQQLIMNLVINAGEAIGEAAGRVTVKTRTKVADTKLEGQGFGSDLPPGRYITLEVADTGAGMDEATKSQIFDPFFTTKFTGRGLGLAAVSGIVRGHKGAIRVESAPGKGSTFEILLPASAAARRTKAPAAMSPELTGKGTVLVVDDEFVVRATARAALEKYGYSVLLAENGPQAIDIIQDHAGEISLVILDLSMPMMSGEEVLEQFRTIRPGLCVIVSSGYSEADAIRRFSGKQIAGFIQKPYTSAQLAAKVKSTLTRSGVQQ